MMDGMGGMGVGMLLWGLIGLALLVLIIVAIVWLVRHLLTGAESRADRAEQELRRRYAAGEIDADEYRWRRNDLREE
ncbi:putative membrane protein [Saccharopolyspora lacisalsi]|uniref:Putative membrane protein n=1 Tax=Halosaccharopolyspora lacisalsi TaxID=1000566 RepID=A0A839DXM6_9PSEU|nr:SHOCT domain-containing protein [Halosaccharopolyspora lacisalsi]MBA8824115.1 putative membrane protein [Halosaccharopolyspora lacisalsi]